MINKCNEQILIQGAQGQDLYINYRLDYPNVTSRMCSASQLIADSRCSTFKVKYIYMINRSTQIILNFAQYIDWKAYKCKDYNLLREKVIKFVNKIERETNTSVTLIGTRECQSDIIDLKK